MGLPNMPYAVRPLTCSLDGTPTVTNNAPGGADHAADIHGNPSLHSDSDPRPSSTRPPPTRGKKLSPQSAIHSMLEIARPQDALPDGRCHMIPRTLTRTLDAALSSFKQLSVELPLPPPIAMPSARYVPTRRCTGAPVLHASSPAAWSG